jgi:hypothetical protein
MNFVRATTDLTRRVTLGDLAERLGVTTLHLSRSRKRPTDRYYQVPPDGWQAEVARLARAQAAQLQKIVEQLTAPRARASKTNRRRRY